jgi:histidinol phosphatase-like PHP family hydrolase
MVATAERIGFEIAISDHYSVPYGMAGDAKLATYLDELERYPIYRAVELDLGAEQPMSAENRARLDYCVGSLHSVVDEQGERVRPNRNSPESMRRYMECAVAQIVRGFRTGLHAMIGHPTFLPDLPREGQDELWEPRYRAQVIDAAIETGVALELSTRYTAPNPVLAREACKAGVRFAVASDGHSPEAIGAFDYARRMIAELEIPPDRFFLPDRLLQARQ